jgi:hypothetical protein
MTVSIQPLLALSEARIQDELWRAELIAADAAVYGRQAARLVLICIVAGLAVLGFSFHITGGELAQVLFYAGVLRALLRAHKDEWVTERLPNKRLKLTAPGLGRNCVCAPTTYGASSIISAAAALGAPQLKRDPLGGVVVTINGATTVAANRAQWR